MKKCGKCGVEKSLSDFHFRKDRNKHYSQCKACWHIKGLAWINKNPERHREYYHNWVSSDPENAKASARKAAATKRSDPRKRAAMGISTAVYIALCGIRKRAPTFQMLGYSKLDLVKHLERQFVRGMSWDNYGEWHIDHIRPLSSFDFTNQDAVREAWALSNLRPLWARENILKKDKRLHLV